MRGMGGGAGRVKSKFILISAYLALTLGFVAGTAIAGTWLGGILAWLSNLGGWLVWAPPALLVAGFVLLVWDCALDNIPNQVGITVSLLTASVVRGVHGWVGTDVTHYCTLLMTLVGKYTGPAIGEGAGFGLAVGAFVGCVLITRRTVPKAAGGAS